MKNFYYNLKCCIVAMVCFLPFAGGAQLNVNSAASAQDLADAILGSGVTISNVSLDCGPGGSGVFSNGGTTNVGIGDGILLTSGRSIDAIGPNNNGGLTFEQPAAFSGDADLSTIVAGSIEDACKLEFDFVAESDFISVQYVFGSEEYNEYVCSVFNDVFGFFVTGNKPAGGTYNGENVALVPSTTLPVSVNTINNGSAGSEGSNANCISLLNSVFYNNNAGGLTIQYDGMTVVLTAQVAVIPGETYHFKFAIADVSDSRLDSGVFIRSQSFSVFNCQAGILEFVGGTPAQICTNDDIADVVSVQSNSTASGDEYAFLLTDLSGQILAINTTGQFDVNSYGAGIYFIFGISYDGIVSGIEVGQPINGIDAAEDEGCFDITAPLTFTIEDCITFELISCAPDVTVECGTDLENFEITGLPQVIITNGGDEELSFSHTDVILSSTDCGYVILRTWIITLGDLSEICTQVITVVDTQGPVFPELNDINVQCLEEVPGFEDLIAIDACSGPAEVETFDSQTGTPESDCILSTAFGPGADWAVWLPVLSSDNVTSSANFVFDANGGHFEQFIDGTAHLYGTVVNSSNNNEQFIVDLWFENKADWATWSGLGRNYKNDLGLGCATADHINWDYFELVGGFSTMTGAGDLAGDVLYVYHMPANFYFGFQLGIGANNKNCNEGLSGWFTYDGFVDGESVEGHGDVNVDADCEPTGNEFDCANNTSFTHFYRAEDVCGHATIVSRDIIVNDTTKPTFDNCPESLTIECSDEIPAVATGITATDNCAGDVTVVYLGETSEGNACDSTLTRVWQATDACGNFERCVQTINILDTTAPVLNGTPAGEITVECDAVPAAAVVTATDNCQEEVTVNFNQSVEEGNCPGNYTIYRYWSAADSCGNGVDFWQTIHVQDTTAPEFDPYEFYAHIECNEIPAVITAHDNCGEATVVVVEEVLNSGGCLGVYYRLYRATDACGNTTDAVQYISILDTTAPEIVGVPAEATIECSEVSLSDNGNYFGNDGVYGVDNCELEVTVTYSEEVVETDDDCAASFDVIRTWVAIDYCDNMSDSSQVVHIVDTTAPGLEIPGDYTAECSDVLYFGEASAWDNCSDYGITEVTDTIEGNCANNYVITRTFVATDACGNASEPQTQTITVSDTTAPIFGLDQQNSYTYECDEVVELIQPYAADNCSEVVEFAYTDTMAWGNSCYNGFTRIWTATDECGNVSFFYQSITIQDTTGPVISGSLELDRPCDDFEGTFVTATDNCNEFEIYHYDEHASGSCAGNVIRHYTAYDICQNASSEFVQIIHLTDVVAPVIDSQTADFQVECGNEYSVTPATFSDNCDEELDITPGFSSETIECVTYETYTWTAVDHCNNITVSTTVVTIVDTQNPWFENFPADAIVNCDEELPAVVYPSAYDACDSQVDIEIAYETLAGDCPQEFYQLRIFRGVDDCGNQVLETQTIHVIDEIAPVFNYDQQYYYTYECDETPELIQPVAEDNCGEIEYSHIDTNFYSVECFTSYYRVWTATDECGNSSQFWQYISIVDTTAPVVDAYEIEIEMPCDQIVDAVLITATDNCNEVIIEFNDEYVSGACAGRIIRTYTIHDICGNYTQGLYEQIITLIDVTAPTAVEPSDITVACDEEVPSFDPMFSDNCDQELVLSHSQPLANGYCNVSVTETWTATDACGNTTTVDRVITYVDEVNPWFTYVPADETHECDEFYILGDASAADNCDLEVSVSVSSAYEAGECDATYTIVRTFVATDECGNTATAEQRIYIQDTQAPYFNYEESDLYLSYECDEVAEVIEPIAADNCSSFELSYSDTLNWTDGCYFGFYRVWTATDACGNASSVYQSISFNDTTAPVVNAFDIEIDMPCDQIVDAVLISAIDNCNDAIITYNDEHVSGGCAGKIIRTYTVRDNCYNYADGLFQQIITLTDTVAPTLENAPENLVVECGSQYASYTPIWNDNCDDDLIVSAISSIGMDGCNQVIGEVYFVEDHCGNENSVSRSITIVDTTAPVLSNLPEDASYDCSEEFGVANVTAYDVCNGELPVDHSDVVLPGNCPSTYTIARTFRASDACGNEAVYVQYISVSDTTAPEFTYVPEGGNYSCEEGIPSDLATAEDDCSTFEVSHSDVSESATITIGGGDDNTDCGQFLTYSVGGYGSGNGPQGSYLASHFASAFPNNLVIGCAGATYTFTSAAAIVNFLPAGGPSSVLPAGNVNNPTGISNQLANQLTAAMISVGLDAADPNFAPSANSLGNAIYNSGPFVGMTVNQVIAIANNHLGGCANTYDLTTIADALAQLNLNYDAGVDNENFVCGGGNSIQLCGTLVTRTWTAEDACGNASTATTEYFLYDNVAPTFDQDLSDVNVECASEIPAPVVVTATDNCSTAEVTVSTEVLESDNCGNQVIAVRYVAVDECGNTAHTAYTIYVLDEVEPTFDNCPTNLVIACDAEIPAAADVTATDNCDQDVDVDFEEFIIGDLPAEGSIADCDLITPVRPANNPCVYPYDWAMALFGMPSAHRWYYVSEGSLVQYPDGSIHLEATMNNVLSPGNGWYVNVWFGSSMDWNEWSSQAFPTSFKADCGGEGANHESWTYLLLQAGEGAELTGFGSYNGSTLNLVHAPANNYFGFQLGDGANNYNAADNAFGGWFSYSGLFQQQAVSGAGDFALELDCCPDYEIVRQWTATDCSGNTTSCVQHITFEGSTPVVQMPTTSDLSDDSDKAVSNVTVSPNPANEKTMFTFTAKNAAKTTLEVFDMTGSKVADVFMGVVESNVEYKVDYNVNHLATGVYTYRLTNGSETEMGRLIISK